MSSNNNSPTERSTKRSNKARKNAVEYQERVLSQVREMFDSILDPDVILSVVQNCNWKLQPSIEHLITLSANVNISTENSVNNVGSNKEDFNEDEHGASADNPDSSPDDDAFEVDNDFTYLNINDEELQKQKDEFKKFELMRRQSLNSPSRLPITSVINESSFETVEDEQTKSSQAHAKKKDYPLNLFIKNDFPKLVSYTDGNLERIKNSGCSQIASYPTYTTFSNDDNSRKDLLTCNQNQLPSFNPEGSSQDAFKNFRQTLNQVGNTKTEERRKTETESLCGLKVQYRFGNLGTSSDDDADVVIEEESNDYTIPILQTTQTNVCQFLSLSTQCPPKTTSPQIEMISTPSPLSSPVNKPKLKESRESILNRIQSTVQNGFKIMVIMRGLPGSGKSHMAREIMQSVDGDQQYIFSTDDFFMKKKGSVYDFDRTRLSDAHEFNQRQVESAVRNGRSLVIVDNTNTQSWEMKPYAAMAVRNGYFIEVLEPDTPWAYNVNELARRNVHGVPKESIKRMLERFEKNITGEKLLRKFSLKYNPYYKPPQFCNPLLSPAKGKRDSPSDFIKTTKEPETDNRSCRKLPEAEEKLEDYVPAGFSNAEKMEAMTNPQNENLSALQLAIKTFGGDDDDLSPKENDQDLIQDNWEYDGVSWEDEMLEVKIENKNSDALKRTLNDESSSMDNKTRYSHEASHQNLGAIGSERKNSMARSTISNDPDGSENERTAVRTGEGDKENDDSSEKSDSSTMSDSSSKFDNFEKSKSPTEELKEAQDTLDKDSPDCGTTSCNTESFEYIDSNSEDLSLEIRESACTKESTELSTDCSQLPGGVEKNTGSLNIDPQAKVSFGLIMKLLKKSILGENNDTSQVTFKTSETVVDSLTEKLHSPVKENSPSSLKNLDYKLEVNSHSNLNDTLSRKLSFIARESGNEDKNMVCEAQTNIENFESLLESSNILSLGRNNTDGLNLEDRLLSALTESEEDSRGGVVKSEQPIELTGPLARAVLSSEENEKLILEEKELIPSETKDFDTANSNGKKDESEQFDITSQYSEAIDNINAITWKESPFPTCQFEVPVSVEESKSVLTSEASTNTDIYDFNVLYVGGTNEPQYKILETFNRSINEGFIPSNLEAAPPLKLKLDKSSMTNEVDVLLELPTISGGIEETDKEIIQGLIDMFPHISKDIVVDVYKNLCECDSFRAIDVLLDGLPLEGIPIAIPSKSGNSGNSSLNSSPARNKRMNRLKPSSSSDSNENEPSPSRKKKKNRVSQDSLALKKQLEQKVMITSSSYHPHILRVKRWKNLEPDMPTEEIVEAQARDKDVLQFVNDLSPTEVVATESPPHSEKFNSDEDDSSASEETTIELNLGWEFITNLEKQFGNPSSQLPDGLFPVIQVKKSLAEEIHALWKESMQQQMDTLQEHLDSMIKKDAEYAKTLAAEEAKVPEVPNLNEVLDMEVSLAFCSEDSGEKKTRETDLDMASRFKQQILNKMFPETDPETLCEIFLAHKSNLRETVEVVEASTGQSFSSTDALNKQNSLMVKVKQQSLAKEEGNSIFEATASKNHAQTHEHALQAARESREEGLRQFSLRTENLKKASEAYRRGNPAVASYYSEIAKLHSRKMDKAHSAAASFFLAAQTHASNEENTLDLHNLFVPEAMQALDIFLDHQLQILSRGRKRSVDLLIITGRGARSSNNRSKIKPAVARRLTRRNICFSEANPGCFKVTLYRHNSASS